MIFFLIHDFHILLIIVLFFISGENGDELDKVLEAIDEGVDDSVNYLHVLDALTGEKRIKEVEYDSPTRRFVKSLTSQGSKSRVGERV